MALNFEPDWLTIISSPRTSTCREGMRYRLSNPAPRPGWDSTRDRKGCSDGTRARLGVFYCLVRPPASPSSPASLRSPGCFSPGLFVRGVGFGSALSPCWRRVAALLQCRGGCHSPRPRWRSVVRGRDGAGARSCAVRRRGDGRRGRRRAARIDKRTVRTGPLAFVRWITSGVRPFTNQAAARERIDMSTKITISQVSTDDRAELVVANLASIDLHEPWIYPCRDDTAFIAYCPAATTNAAPVSSPASRRAGNSRASSISARSSHDRSRMPIWAITASRVRKAVV